MVAFFLELYPGCCQTLMKYGYVNMSAMLVGAKLTGYPMQVNRKAVVIMD